MRTLYISKRRIDSETIHIPELREVIGRDVDILVVERNGEIDLQMLDAIAGKIGLDYDAITELRKISIV